MPRLLSRIIKYWSPPCFVAVGLLVMAFAFFGGSALSEPLVAPQSAPALAPTVPPSDVVTQTWEDPGIYGAQVSSVAIDASDDPPSGTIHVGTTSASGLYRGTDGGGGGEVDDSGSELSPTILRRHEYFLARRG